MFSMKYFFNPLPINTRELTVRGIGIQEKMPATIVSRPKGTGDYLLMVFFNDVQFTARDGTADRKTGSIVLWRPESGHYYGCPTATWRHSWVHCKGTMIDDMIEKVGIPTDTAMMLSDPFICDKYLFDLYIELIGRSAPDAMITRNILENLLREIMRMQRVSQPARIPEAVATARSYIESHYTESLSLDSIADQANISVPHLCALFKQHCNVSVMAYVIRLRMAKAELLIRDTDLAIRHVARAVGYDDLFYFSKLFKKHFGKPPRNARAKR